MPFLTKEKTNWAFIAIVAFFAVIAGIVILFSTNLEKESVNPEEINSFEECVSAGYPVMESYPRQCKTSEGKTFIEDIQLDQVPIAQALYLCDGEKTIEATFYQGEEITTEPGEQPVPSGSVEIVLSDGRSFNLNQTISASGARYSNTDESFIFWSKGDEALVLEDGVEKDYTGCVALPNEGITVVSPNGGEVWLNGQMVQISWRSADEVEFVDIRLKIEEEGEGQSFNAAIASNIENTGEYEWIVQELYAEVLGIEDLPVSDKYLIIIEDSEDNSIYDISDVTFTIN